MDEQENESQRITDAPVQPSGLAYIDSWPRDLQQSLTRELIRVIGQADQEQDEDEPADELSMEAEALLADALRERATDIHIDANSTGVMVRLRIDGRIFDSVLLNEQTGIRLINQFKAMARLNIERRFRPEESRITYSLLDRDIDLRFTSAPTLRGQKLSIRVFQPLEEMLHLQQLGLNEQGLEQIQDWIDTISGMLLVAGPTGSGKTTTLYSLLHKLKLKERNVVTIEDPVEYEIDGVNQIQVDHYHGLEFAEGIKAMLRLDPDYLMLGEIREAASAQAGVVAATSGRALMGTLHSRDAVGVIDTLRNYGLGGQDISSTLVLVIAQRLVRKLCEHCKTEGEPTSDERQWLKKLGREAPSRVWHAVGCEHCRQLGYEGRTGIFEIWRINPQEYQLLLEGADRRTLYRQLNERHHRFLIDDGLEKVSEGVTSLSELQVMGGLSTLPHIDMLGDNPSDN